MSKFPRLQVSGRAAFLRSPCIAPVRRRLCAGAALAALLAAGPAAAEAETDESLVDKLMSVLGLTASSAVMRGEEKPVDGDIWSVSLQDGKETALTRGGGFRSPLFMPDGQRLLALKGGSIVEIQAGPPKPVAPAPEVTRLLVFNPSNPNELLVLRGMPPRLAKLRLSPPGTPQPLRVSPSSETALLGWAQDSVRRTDDLLVQTHTRTSPPAGTEIRLTRDGQKSSTVVDCGDSRCGQASLSPDKRQVVFVRSEPQ